MNDRTAAESAMTPGKGLLVLLAIIVVVGAFLALGHALGVAEIWAAFLFLLYWAGIEHAAVDRLPACISGAVLGLLLGYLLKMLPLWLGAATGGGVFLALVLLLVYCQVMGWLVVAVNMVTMLYLTVTTIPAIQSGVDFGGAFSALALGIVYFGGLVMAAQWGQKRWAASRMPA
ncbi:hypothetical protein B9N43_03905 [Denitratisoma sp. DHT3]|uniref:hypothetical protein n=1 Tax=Denitratisoma sp. DHT3 TaxID=1981880 RepID=UPI0011987E2D|nr:hypothetical protein [Denitratisoma sp. DHT3]QDX80473.1 hypothetical protein B9N43_03905 [Denitratisoma sp. DHT3]